MMKIKGINALARQVNKLQDMIEETYPRSGSLYEKVKEASLKRRFRADIYIKTAMANKAGSEEVYNEEIKNTFDERITLMLVQVLDYAAMHDVDLEHMLTIIEERGLRDRLKRPNPKPFNPPYKTFKAG